LVLYYPNTEEQIKKLGSVYSRGNIEAILSISRILNDNPDFLTVNLVKQLISISGKCYMLLVDMQTTMGLLNGADIDSDILQMSIMGFEAYILALRSGLLNNGEKVALQGIISELKSKTSDLTKFIVTRDGQNITNNILGNEYISTQVYNTNYLNESTNAALENNLSTVDLLACLDKLREYYHMKGSDSFTVIKRDSTPDKNLTSSAGTKVVDIDIYSMNGQRLNRSICDDNSIVVKIPLQNNSNINKDVYSSYRNQSIDIYNPEDPMFNSRCYRFTMNDYDTTINMRRRLIYTNFSITCNNCIYNGIESNYIQCSCSGQEEDDELTPRIFTYILDSYDDLNIDIIKCAGKAFNVNYFNSRKILSTILDSITAVRFLPSMQLG
jgi:hypothetical protein